MLDMIDGKITDAAVSMLQQGSFLRWAPTLLCEMNMSTLLGNGIAEGVSKTGCQGGLTSSSNKKGLRCRMTTRVGALESPDVGGPSRYLG